MQLDIRRAKLSGEWNDSIDGQLIRVKQGDAVFINADTMHMAAKAGEHGNVVVLQ